MTEINERRAAALEHLEMAQRDLANVPGLPNGTKSRHVGVVGILGAGTMGTGIAMNFAAIGVPTFLVDTTDAAIQRGLASIQKTYASAVAKGKLTAREQEQRSAAIVMATDDSVLSQCDLVIEAIFENLEIKQQVCKRLGTICKPGAIIASNTSTLDVNTLAQASGRPADFVGMHFFSPAHVMKLLEIVRGKSTAPDVLTTVVELASAIGKIPVISGVCYGFIGNRMAEPYVREADALLLEGADPFQIDGVAERFGMAMGPCRMLDMAGVDVAAKTVLERRKAGGLPSDTSYRAVVLRLFELGSYGQKSGTGYYRYDGRNYLSNPDLPRLCEALAKHHGVARRGHIEDQEVFERLFYPLINEGARILEEGISSRAGDIDIVWTAGYGFPKTVGGPMFLADQIGLSVIAERLAYYAAQRGDAFSYWSPSPLLIKLAIDATRLSSVKNT